MSDQYTDYGFDFGDVPKVEDTDYTIGEKLKAYYSIGSSIAHKAINPELQGTNKVDPNFNLIDYMKPLSPNQRDLVKMARNEEYANIMLATEADFQTQSEVIANDPLPLKVAGIIGASITGDPTTFVPVGGLATKAQSIVRAERAMNAMADVGKFGAAGAGFAVLGEAQAEGTGELQQGDFTTVGMFGFALGGGITGLAHMGRGSGYTPQQQVDITNINNSSVTLTKQLNGEEPFEPPKVTHWAGTFGPSWSKSGILNVATSDNKVAREMAYRMDAPAMYAVNDASGEVMPLRKNATDYKIQQQQVHTKYSLEANEQFNRARAEEGYTKSFEDLSADAYHVIQDGYAAQREGRTWSFPDTAAGRQAKAFNDYTVTMLKEGKNLGIKQLDDIDPGKIYVPRLMNFTRIQEASPVEVRNRVLAAIAKVNTDKTADEISELAEEYISNLDKLGMQREFADFGMFTPKDLPNTGRLQARIPMDDRELGDFVIQDLNELSAKYHYSQSGLYSVYKAFPEVKGMNTEDAMTNIRGMFANVRDEAINSGQPLDKARIDFEALENMLQDLLGVLRMSDNPNTFGMRAARMSTKFNSIAHGGQFVINAAAEMGNTVLSKDFKSVFNKEFAPAVKDIAKILYKGKKPDTDMVKLMMNMGLLSELTEFKGFIRHAEVDTMFSGGNVENYLNKGNQALYKYNLTTPMTSMLEVVNGIGAFNHIINIANKGAVTEKEARTLSRLGVSKEDLPHIKELPYIKKEGYNVGIDFERLTPEQEDVLDTLMVASQREARQTVAKGIGSYSPDAIKKPTPMKIMALQFLRTPIEMNETLLRRGLSEDKAGMVVSAIGSVSIMASILYLREQAEIAAGIKKEIDAKYDFDDKDKWANLMYTSWSKVGVMGLASTIMEKGASAAGVPLPGREYADRDLVKGLLGASFSSADDAVTLMQSAVNGKFGDSRSVNAAINLTPFHSLPVLNESLRAFARDR